MTKTVLISGASIAGPSLAYWLDRYGFQVTVVEKADALRPGGQAVDFKGETHRTVLRRMGILDDVRRLQTGGSDGRVVDARGRTLAVVPGEFSGGEIEIARGDLAQLLYERTKDSCEYIFGDSITSLTETGGPAGELTETGGPAGELTETGGPAGKLAGAGRAARKPAKARSSKGELIETRGSAGDLPGAGNPDAAGEDRHRRTGGGVEVTFARSAPRTFDLVVGADGIHSNVRRLAVGPESEFVRHLGYYYALADVDVDDADEMYCEPGRMAAVGGAKAPAFFVFASEPLEYDRDDVDQQKQLVSDAYQGAGWRVPELIAQLPAAKEFYLDAIARVTTDRYHQGRAVLLGDAAYGNTLGGFGTGLAMVGAYVLAGELHRAGGDHTVAYPKYETAFRGYAKVSQQVSAGRLLAPRTRLGMRGRNALFSVSFLFKPMMKLMDRFATDIKLEDYSKP